MKNRKHFIRVVTTTDEAIFELITNDNLSKPDNIWFWGRFSEGWVKTLATTPPSIEEITYN